MDLRRSTCWALLAAGALAVLAGLRRRVAVDPAAPPPSAAANGNAALDGGDAQVTVT